MSPLLHHLPTLFQGIPAPVCSFYFILQSVSQCLLSQLSGEIGFSPAQSRKMDRKPWGTASAFIRRMTAVMVMSESAWPLVPGKSSSVPVSRGSFLSSLTASSGSGTRYAVRGILHRLLTHLDKMALLDCDPPRDFSGSVVKQIVHPTTARMLADTLNGSC